MESLCNSEEAYFGSDDIPRSAGSSCNMATRRPTTQGRQASPFLGAREGAGSMMFFLEFFTGSSVWCGVRVSWCVCVVEGGDSRHQQQRRGQRG